MKAHLIRIAVAVFVVTAASSSIAVAQTTFNPTKLSFNKSADHAAQLADGTNVLTGYRENTFLKGAAAPIMKVDLCKPTPDASGVITVVTTSSPCPTGGLLFGTPLVVNTTYETAVSAYGPGGESLVSARSNPFALLGAPVGVVGNPIVAP